jgi:SNF2 family DNA or RNA helicase
MNEPKSSPTDSCHKVLKFGSTYEMCLIEKSVLKKFSFEYVVIDEVHRIKNVGSILSQIVRAFTNQGRLLITGTPLQNNLKELFALLNFICPEIFVNYKDLDDFLHKDATGTDGAEEKSKKVVEALHKILRPFLLRRVKSDVEKNLLPSSYCLSCYCHLFLTNSQIYMWGFRKCTANSIDPSWKRTSVP